MHVSGIFKLLPLAIAINITFSPLAAADEAQNTESVEKIEVRGSYSISEVIDTATGLGLTLQETPQSVSVVTAQQVRDQALDTISDAVIHAVGVSGKEIDNVRNTFRARGFDINNYQVDGVPLSWSLAGDSGETIADLSIYERIEFVRGATGLLTGAGDPSASINLVRKHAKATDLEGYVNGAVGSWSNYEVSTDLAGGLNDSGSVRGRVVAKDRQGDSYLDLYEDKVTVLYGVLDADLTDTTLLRVGMSYQQNDPTAPTWGALPSFFTDGSLTDWDVSQTTAAHWTEWQTTSKNLFANLEHMLSNGWQLALNYNRLDYEQESKLLYLFGNVDKATGGGLASWPYRSVGDSKQDSIDLQLRGDFGAFGQQHDFVVGYLYGKQNGDTRTYDPIANAFLPVDNFYQWDGNFPEATWAETTTTAVDLETKQKGFYAASRLSLSDRLKLIAGGRVSSWQRQGLNYGATLDFGDSGEFTPYLGVLYDITEQHKLYASYTEIFMPQDAYDRNGDFLDPLTGKNSEIGLKSSFLDDMLHTALSIFRIEQDNLAQNDDAHADPQNNFFPSFAARGIESKGFEVEVVGQPLPQWNISLGYSQFEAEDAGGTDVNTDHPRKQLKLFTTYDFSNNLDGLTIGGGVNWQGESYSNDVNPVTGEPLKLVQDAYTLVSLMARYDLSEQLQVQLNLDNVLDEKYYSQIGFFSQYRYGPPANVRLGVTYSF